MTFPSHRKLLLFSKTRCVSVRELEQFLRLTWCYSECVLLRMIPLKDPYRHQGPRARQKPMGNIFWLNQAQLGYVFYGPEIPEGPSFLLPRCQYMKLEWKGWFSGIICLHPGVLSKELYVLCLVSYKAQEKPGWCVGYYLANEVWQAKFF